MANTVRNKRGSGSDPSASDLVLGEIAVRTDTGQLFVKKDDGSVASIAGGISDGDKGDITVSSSGATFTIDSGVVTSAKISDNTIVNADINSSAAIAGTKISPDFGSQNIITTGTVEAADVQLAGTIFHDGDTDTKFEFGTNQILLKTGNATRLDINNSAIMVRSGFALGFSATTGNSPNIKSGNTNNQELLFTVDNTERLAVEATGIDVTGNIAVSGTVDGREVPTDGSKLDGIASGATNVTNTNQLTNGAGFITATLTNEQVQDIVGAMVSSNTETGISVTYQDGDGTLDFVVASQTDNNFTNADHSKLDGIEANATADQTAAEIRALVESASDSNVFTDADHSKLNGIAAGATNVTNTNQLTNGAGFITATLTNEQVQDIVGGMVSGNTESGITVTYQDGDGTLDFSVASQTDQNFTTTLKNKLDGIAASATNVTNNNQISNGAGYVTSSVINSLNANNLSSGTIPDARFPSTLPAIDGSNLTGIGGGATGGGSDEVFYENGQTVTTNYTITNGKNAMAAGPITINSGVTVTVGAGETLTIV